MVFVDIETYSEADLPKVGTHAYARHPSTEILICCWAEGDNPVQVWDVTEQPPPPDLLHALGNGWLCAHHAAFERLVFQYAFDQPTQIEQWHDTAVLALICGLPASLGMVGKVLGWGDDKAKMADGQKLVRMFSMPTPGNHIKRRYTKADKPEQWARFIDYCVRDVEASRRLWYELPHAVYELERENWLIDQAINDRGLPVDVEFINAAIEATQEAIARGNAELSYLTKGAVSSVTELAGMREWLEGFGMRFASLDKAGVTALLAQVLPTPARRALELRQEVGRSGVAKYTAAANSQTNGRVYGTLQFYGANRTGRAAGRLVQPQNMQRPTLHGDDYDQGVAAIKHRTVGILHD